MAKRQKYFITALYFIISYYGFSQTQITIDSLKNVLKNVTHDTTRCRILNEIIEAEENDEIWPIYNAQLKSLTEKNLKEPLTNDIKRIYLKYLAAAINNIGINADTNGDFSLALKCYEKSLTIQRQIQDSSGIATSLVKIRTLYSLQGNNLIALNYYEKSLAIQNDLNDKKGIAASLHNIATIYNDQGDQLNAREYFFKSLKIEEEINNKYGIATSLSQIGTNYRQSKDFKRALEYYKKSLSLSQEIGNSLGQKNVYEGLSSLFYEQNDLVKAMLYSQKFLELSEKINDVFGISASLGAIGSIYFKKKDYIKALDNCNKSLVIAQKCGYSTLIGNSAETLKNIYKALHQPAKALEMYELYIATNKKLVNDETKKASIKSQYKYEYELKAKEEKIKTEQEKKLAAIRQDKEKTQRFFLYGFLALTLIFSIFIFNRFRLTQKQKIIIEKQKCLVEEKQKETIDSINYAKRIQHALIANKELLSENLNEHFVFFNPKDIVSGDFYWATEYQNKFYLAVCDSTGHGVPGAFMSLLNMGFLAEAIKEKNILTPNEIFDFVRKRLINAIGEDGQQDGMDAILICINKLENTITYSAANNTPILVRENKIIELFKDKMPVGKGEKAENFKLFSIDFQKGDCLYLYTDGYADQFGGERGKKFKYKQLNELLLSVCNDKLTNQSSILKHTFNNWKGDLEQVDDVLIIGFKL